MTRTIVYIDRSRILPGKLDEVREAIRGLVRFIDDQEPQLLFYNFYVDAEEHRMTVVAVHPDADSLEFHLDVGASAFREFADLIEMESIEVYGEPTEPVLEQLARKANDLGDQGSVTIHERHDGFSRISSPVGSRADKALEPQT